MAGWGKEKHVFNLMKKILKIIWQGACLHLLHEGKCLIALWYGHWLWKQQSPTLVIRYSRWLWRQSPTLWVDLLLQFHHHLQSILRGKGISRRTRWRTVLPLLVTWLVFLCIVEMPAALAVAALISVIEKIYHQSLPTVPTWRTVYPFFFFFNFLQVTLRSVRYAWPIWTWFVEYRQCLTLIQEHVFSVLDSLSHVWSKCQSWGC